MNHESQHSCACCTCDKQQSNLVAIWYQTALSEHHLSKSYISNTKFVLTWLSFLSQKQRNVDMWGFMIAFQLFSHANCCHKWEIDFNKMYLSWLKCMKKYGKWCKLFRALWACEQAVTWKAFATTPCFSHLGSQEDFLTMYIPQLCYMMLNCSNIVYKILTECKVLPYCVFHHVLLFIEAFVHWWPSTLWWWFLDLCSGQHSPRQEHTLRAPMQRVCVCSNDCVYIQMDIMALFIPMVCLWRLKLQSQNLWTKR